MVTRRRFLAHTAPLTLAPWLGGCASHSSSIGGTELGPAAPPATSGFAFLHGVASGDPLADAVILWTRVTPTALLPDVPAESRAPLAADSAASSVADAGALAWVLVDWRVARDPDLNDVVQQGQIETSGALDYTAKVDVSGLAPATTYFYQFRVGAIGSPIGRTRTSPAAHTERLRFAVTSCANHPQGFFHAYRMIAERPELDLVLYLGDYIYEYGNGSFGDGEPLGRVPDPDREIVTLDDYRRRHAQYKLDPDLQEVHRQHPAVAVWDDHEVADNAYRDGARNHQVGSEGDWAARKQAAMRAFHEWLPIRAPLPGELSRIYRSFPFGDLLDLIMLDTRLVGRDPLIADPCDESQVDDPARSLLGAEQEAWLASQLSASQQRGARWRLVGQQVAFAHFLGDPAVAGCIGSVDKWSSYGASRSRVLDAIERGGIDNVVILTGDSHSSWGLDVARDPFDPNVYDPATGRGSLAVELIGPGVSSPAIPDAAQAKASELRYKATHPHIRFAEQHSQGYFIVDVTHERLRAEWYFVSPVRELAALERLGGAVVTLAGLSHLTPAS